MTSDLNPLKKLTDLGDLEKWPKLHWGGWPPSLPPPRGGAYVLVPFQSKFLAPSNNRYRLSFNINSSKYAPSSLKS